MYDPKGLSEDHLLCNVKYRSALHSDKMLLHFTAVTADARLPPQDSGCASA